MARVQGGGGGRGAPAGPPLPLSKSASSTPRQEAKDKESGPVEMNKKKPKKEPQKEPTKDKKGAKSSSGGGDATGAGSGGGVFGAIGRRLRPGRGGDDSTPVEPPDEYSDEEAVGTPDEYEARGSSLAVPEKLASEDESGDEYEDNPMATFGGLDVSATSSLAELKKFIDDHKLSVNKKLGGATKRTKLDIYNDIVSAMDMTAP